VKLYQAFDVDEETPVQWLAVHPLRWQEHWGEPAIMFCEVDDKEQALFDAAPALLAACKLAKERLSHMRQERGYPGEDWDYEKAQEILALAIAKVEGGQ